MARILIFILALMGSAFAVEVNFNNYQGEDATGSGYYSDRTNTGMLNRHSVAGMLKCAVPELPALEFNHFFGPGQYNMDGEMRKKLGYYWNPGIQEFGKVNSSALVTAAYLWSPVLTYGWNGDFGCVSGAIGVTLDSISGPEPIWDQSVNFMSYDVCNFVSDSDAGTYSGYQGQSVGEDMYVSLSEAIAARRAYVVTKAVKYIMDHHNEDTLGIIVKSDSGPGQLGFPAEENNTTGMGFRLILTIVYNGTPEVAVEKNPVKSASLTLAQNNPNPFHANTAIRFNVPNNEKARLAVYTVNGQLVRTLFDGAASGHQNVNWDGLNSRGSKMNSGVYIYKLTTGNKTVVKKMILMQ